MKPLAITGVGMISAVGVGTAVHRLALEDTQEAARQAFSRQPTVFDPERVGPAHAAEVWDFDAKEYLGKKGLRNLDRLTRFLVVAARQSLEDAGVKEDGEFRAHSPERVGVCSSTAYGSLDAITELNLVAELEDPRYINPSRFPNTVINAAAGYVSIWEDLRAPNVTVVDGNCGGLDTVLTCETHLMHGRADAFLVGGGEVLSEPLYLAFRRLGLLAESAGAHGVHLGEAAAYLTVERADEAEARGAKVRGRLLGYGTAFDPPKSEALLVHASSDSVQRAIEIALLDADLSAADIDVVCSAASGQAFVDQAEMSGIAAVLGNEVAIAGPKRVFGETFGAAGALGMALSTLWFDGLPPSPIVSGQLSSSRPLDTVLVLAVGFYGNASAVVVGRP